MEGMGAVAVLETVDRWLREGSCERAEEGNRYDGLERGAERVVRGRLYFGLVLRTSCMGERERID